MVEAAHRWRRNFLSAGAKFLWFCLPFKQVSVIDHLSSSESWITWEPGKEDVWMRKPPDFAIMYSPYLHYPGEMNYQTFCGKAFADGIQLVGLRTAESLTRLKCIANAKMERIVRGGKFYPIYDWRDSDVWLYIKQRDLEFPEIYMRLYEAGVRKNALRLCAFFGDCSTQGLRWVAETDADLWDRIQKRERWMSRCPHCREYHEIQWEDITRAGTVMQQGTPQDAAHFTNQEDGIWELFACYGLLLNYARQMGWDVERGSINLTNTAKPSRQMSSNYAISSDGGIALLCHEADRSWCSSSPANDHRAITVEVANDQIGGQWHVSDAALEALVKLCVDICQRNPALKNGLNYTGDARGNLTKHSYFTSTACPGPYLGGKFSWLAEEVNKRLAGGVTVAGDALRAGMALHLERTNLYIASASLAIAGVRTGTYYLWGTEVVNGRVRITNSTSNVGKYGKVTGWISVDDAKAGAGLRDQTTDSRGLTKIVIDYASNVQAMAVYNLAQQLDLVAPGYYRSRYIDAAKTAQYIEIGQISAGDAEHVTTLCKKAGRCGPGGCCRSSCAFRPAGHQFATFCPSIGLCLFVFP